MVTFWLGVIVVVSLICGTVLLLGGVSEWWMVWVIGVCLFAFMLLIGSNVKSESRRTWPEREE